MTLPAAALWLVLSSWGAAGPAAPTAASSSPAPAPSGPAPPRAGLTPDDAVRLALQRSGAVQAARLGAERDKLRRGLSYAPFRLRVGDRSADGLFGTPHTDNNGNAYGVLDDTFITLDWKPPNPAELTDLLADDAAAQADDLDVVDRERDLAAEVRTLHAQVLALRGEERLAENALAIAARLEKQTQAQLQAEAATALDARFVALRRLDAAADVEDVRSDADRAEHRLAALVGRAAPLSLAPPATPLCAGAPADVNALVRRARTQSVRLQALKARRDRAHIQASLAWAAWAPYVEDVLVGYYDEPLDKQNSVRARLSIALPFLEPLSDTGRAAAIDEQRIDALYADAARELEADVRSAFDRLQGAAALVKLYEDSQKEIVEEGLADVQRALDAGQADVVRAAEVQARAVSAQRGLVHARARCDAAAVDLMRFTGDVTR